MEGRLILNRKEREELRERWLQRAGKAFERMFGKANQEQLVTLTEREDMACALGDELAVFLLEEHAAADGQVRPSDKRTPCCPKCQQPSERVATRNEKLPERELTTWAGEIQLRREQWRCKPCRILFFSVGPEAEIGNGAVQSAGLGEGGAAGLQGGVLQGSQ